VDSESLQLSKTGLLRRDDGIGPQIGRGLAELGWLEMLDESQTRSPFGVTVLGETGAHALAQTTSC